VLNSPRRRSPTSMCGSGRLHRSTSRSPWSSRAGCGGHRAENNGPDRHDRDRSHHRGWGRTQRAGSDGWR